MSAMGVIFLNRALHTSRQTGTYLSNRIVKLARSDWTSRVSIQLLTYLCRKERSGENLTYHLEIVSLSNVR